MQVGNCRRRHLVLFEGTIDTPIPPFCGSAFCRSVSEKNVTSLPSLNPSVRFLELYLWTPGRYALTRILPEVIVVLFCLDLRCPQL